jgi:hypothetical protein
MADPHETVTKLYARTQLIVGATSELLKITGQICLNLAFQRSALKSNSLAGNF